MTAIEAAPAPSRRLAWQRASVREIVVETPRVKSVMLHVPDWRGHRAGQHVDIRLTGEDGYQAQRSYSIASPPEDALLALTVERVATARGMRIARLPRCCIRRAAAATSFIVRSSTQWLGATAACASSRR
jgi:hypothetical protein